MEKPKSGTRLFATLCSILFVGFLLWSQHARYERSLQRSYTSQEAIKTLMLEQQNTINQQKETIKTLEDQAHRQK
jgi:hypothetical protein